MHEVEGPGIDRQLLERGDLEVSLPQEICRCGGEDLESPRHEPRIATVGYAGPGHVQRHRAHSLMGIRGRQPAVFEHRHGPPADIVVEPLDRGGHEPFVGTALRLNRRAGIAVGFGQEGPDRRHHEERPFDPAGGLVLEQVRVKLPVGRQQAVEEQAEHLPRLPGIAEGWLGGLEFAQACAESRGDQLDRVGPLADEPVGAGGLILRIEFTQGTPGRRVESTRREVQIADDDGCRIGLSGRRRDAGHASEGFEGRRQRPTILTAPGTPPRVPGDRPAARGRETRGSAADFIP